MSAAQKAIPVPDERTKPYWDAARERKFILQRCTDCSLWSSQPRPICPVCHGSNFEWAEPSGRGKIHSWTIAHQTTAAGFQDEVPYVIVHAAIDEEPTCYVSTNLIIDQADFDKINIDAPVVMDFEDRGEVTVPQWRMA